ncbi:Putative ribonuclease H protein At1g65750 [Linum perenne]
MEPPTRDGCEDELIWGPDPKGKFSIKTAYEILDTYSDVSTGSIWRSIWKWEGPNRVRHFLWLIAHEKVLTNSERCRRHLTDDSRCHRCPNSVEDVLHVCRDCTLAKEVWSALFPQLWIAGVRETMKADSYVMSNPAPLRQEALIQWSPAPEGFITINTDGSVIQPSKHAAGGGILRDWQGRKITAFAVNLETCSIMRAELKAADIGLKIAWEMGFRRVHLQLDSKAVVNTICGDIDEDSRHSQTIRSIHRWINRDWEIHVSHVFREANKVADLLAHFGHNLDFCFSGNCLYPSHIDREIWNDFNGASSPRMVIFNE